MRNQEKIQKKKLFWFTVFFSSFSENKKNKKKSRSVTFLRELLLIRIERQKEIIIAKRG